MGVLHVNISGHYAAAPLNHNNTYYGSYDCPCKQNNTIIAPPFIGIDYYCESGATSCCSGITIHLNDPLWDGQQCGESLCCIGFSPNLIPSQPSYSSTPMPSQAGFSPMPNSQLPTPTQSGSNLQHTPMTQTQFGLSYALTSTPLGCTATPTSLSYTPVNKKIKKISIEIKRM